MDFSQLPWTSTGIGGIVVLTVVMILRGLIVPRYLVNQMTELYEKRISEKSEEAKTWKEAWEISQENQRLKDKQLEELLEVARTTQAVLKALPSASSYKVIEK